VEGYYDFLGQHSLGNSHFGLPSHKTNRILVPVTGDERFLAAFTQRLTPMLANNLSLISLTRKPAETVWSFGPLSFAQNLRQRFACTLLIRIDNPIDGNALWVLQRLNVFFAIDGNDDATCYV
jgi:hypothetical protein